MLSPYNTQVVPPNEIAAQCGVSKHCNSHELSDVAGGPDAEITSDEPPVWMPRKAHFAPSSGFATTVHGVEDVVVVVVVVKVLADGVTDFCPYDGLFVR
jgi:hypothetical protein